MNTTDRVNELLATSRTVEEIRLVTEAVRRAGLGADVLADALRKITGPFPVSRWNSDDALQLILEEIKHADDPLKAAGQWITRFTNGVTDITRNLEE